MGVLRLEVFDTAKPRRRVLVSVDANATRDVLFDAICVRLGVRPERCFLGESQAEVVTVTDLADGDVLRVQPTITDNEAIQTVAASEQGGWQLLIRLILTLAIFVFLEEGFQRFVYLPWFTPDLARGEREVD
jgi:hypothetical protein